MIYKQFIWHIDDKYVAVFPELHPIDITVGEDKDEVRRQSKVKAIIQLREMPEMPPNLSIVEAFALVDELPQEDLISASAIDLTV